MEPAFYVLYKTFLWCILIAAPIFAAAKGRREISIYVFGGVYVYIEFIFALFCLLIVYLGLKELRAGMFMARLGPPMLMALALYTGIRLMNTKIIK